MLTNEQLAFFELFGYLKLESLFAPAEVVEIGREFDALILEARGSKQPTGERECYQSFVERRNSLTRLIDDDRIYTNLEQILGPDLVWVTSGGNLYVGDTKWHRDATLKGYSQIKTVLYLDPVGRDSGCMRVIPGSHQPPIHYAMEPLLESDAKSFGVEPVDVPCVCIETEPGDVVVINETIWHATFGGRDQRRMLSLSFVPYPRERPHIDYLRRLYEAVTIQDEPREPFFRSERPRIRGLVERIRALDLEV